MDFFQHRYYRLSKTFMTLSGNWPYQSTRSRCGILVALMFILISHIVPQILALVKYRDEQEIVLECIVTFLYEAVCATKGISCLLNSQKVMKLLNRIRTNWQVWARDQEVNILHEYAEKGRKISIAFTAETYSVAFVYLTQPTIPKIIDVLLKNGTAPGEFPSPVDYYHLDSQKYYFYIVMYTYVCLCIVAITVVASEIMLIIYVQHVCGVFAALGCSYGAGTDTDKVVLTVQSGGTSHAFDKRDMIDLASCIDRHNDAIDCANLIEATYTWTIFCIIGFSMIALNIVGLQIVLGKSNREATVKFLCVALAIILQLFIECYISQYLMDHSISIHFYIQESQWYKLAPKAQNLLQLMIMRCGVSCKLTAGKFFVLSMRTFGQTLRTVMSYFTVLRSMQI